jgi:hypothetical protein
MNKKTNFFFKKKTYKFFLYTLLFIVIIFLVYLSIPKLFNYTPQLVEESLKKNSDFKIKNISKTNYHFFPSPRLRLYGTNLELEESILKVEGAEIDIILNPLSLINYKKLNYNKILITGGLTNVKVSKINKLLDYLKKNKKKINFKKNTIIILKEKKKLFEINTSTIKINSKNNIRLLDISGLLSNYKISFLLENKLENKSNITLKIPELDILANVSLQSKDNFKTLEGLISFAVLNNLFQFNFAKEKNITIKKGYVRNNLINSSFEGKVFFKPHFFFTLDIKLLKINLEKLFFIVKKNYFSENLHGLKIIEKLNGSLNFKDMLQGNVIFKNKEILFQNFKTNKNMPIHLDAKISEFGKKGKIKFNLLKNIQHKKNSIKELQISGFVTPTSSKVVFEKILLDKEVFSDRKIKNYEEKFRNDVINGSIGNIFNDIKINNFLKSFIN